MSRPLRLRCPECGGEIQATLAMDHVFALRNGRFEPVSTPVVVDLSYRCENDHANFPSDLLKQLDRAFQPVADSISRPPRRPAQPKRGDIAISSCGWVGVIDCDQPKEIEYPDGQKVTAWTGRTVAPAEVAGKRWSSRDPIVLAQRMEEISR